MNLYFHFYILNVEKYIFNLSTNLFQLLEKYSWWLMGPGTGGGWWSGGWRRAEEAGWTI